MKNSKRIFHLCLLYLVIQTTVAIDYEFSVPKSSTICFEDFVSNATIITYGYSPFPAQTLEDLLVQISDSSKNSRGRVLQAKPNKSKTESNTTTSKGPNSNELAGEELKNEEAEIEGDFKAPKSTKKKRDNTKQETENLGKLTIKTNKGDLLSPKNLKPFTLYKLKFPDYPLNIIEICYQNTAATDMLVRLYYKVHHPILDVKETVPSKENSDEIFQKLVKIEKTFEEALANYEELQRFEQNFVSSSNSTLSSFMIFGQLLLLAYLVVGWILRVAIEKTFRYKKII